MVALGLQPKEAVCSAVIIEINSRCQTSVFFSSMPHTTPNLPCSLFSSLLPFFLYLSFYLLSLPTCFYLCHPHSPPRCCLAPASAAKFPEAVLAAGLTPQIPSEVSALEKKETRCTPMRKSDDWTLMLRDTIEDLGQQWRGHFLNAPE